jgi:hypothetical protein
MTDGLLQMLSIQVHEVVTSAILPSGNWLEDHVKKKPLPDVLPVLDTINRWQIHFKLKSLTFRSAPVCSKHTNSLLISQQKHKATHAKDTESKIN